MNYIQKDQVLFDYLLHREQCIYVPEYKTHVKDLGLLLCGRKLKDLIIVDNKVESYSKQIENGIPIKDFHGDKKDKTLLSLKKYLLHKIRGVNDVRKVIAADFLKREDE